MQMGWNITTHILYLIADISLLEISKVIHLKQISNLTKNQSHFCMRKKKQHQWTNHLRFIAKSYFASLRFYKERFQILLGSWKNILRGEKIMQF